MSNLLNRIIETGKIDICRLYPNACHEPMQNNFRLGVGKYLTSKLALVCLPIDIAIYIVRTIWACLRPNNCPSIDLTDNVVYAWQSGNQRTSLAPIKAESEKFHAACVLDGRQLDWVRRRGLTHIVSWLFLPICIYRYWKTQGYARKTFKLVFTEHLHGYGMYFYLRNRLEEQKPAAVVVSNDHIQIPCLLVAAAKAAGIPTLYVQHACVTRSFPPLAVDYALLDGRDAALKYQKAGESVTKICLIGPTRLDGYTRFINRRTVVESIGLCFSVADEEHRILELLNTVAELSEFRTVVRPHYRMCQKVQAKIRAFTIKHGFEYSDHKTVPALEFMKSIDLLVAGVSAITMEAAMMDLTLVNYNLNSIDADWYGFIEHGLVIQLNKPKELSNFILANRTNRTRSRNLAKHYASSIDTSHDGSSATVAAQIVNSVALAIPNKLIDDLSFSRNDKMLK